MFILFVAACISLQELAIINLNNLYPNLPIAADFLFEHTPYVNMLWVADLISFFALISFLAFIFLKKRGKEFPFYATIVGVYFLLRSVFIYLTPLGNPHPVPGLLKFLPNGGMFPSGHVGLIFLFFLSTLKTKSKYWSIYFIILVIFEFVAMILSRGHYTIDMVGAIFIAYTIWKITNEHFKEKLTLK